MAFFAVLLLLLFSVERSQGCIATQNVENPRVPGLPEIPNGRNCKSCNPVEVRLGAPFKAMDLDEGGIDAADQCATRRFECRGVENPRRTLLVWDEPNGVFSEDGPGFAGATIKCNTDGQWILAQNGRNIPVTEVGCVAVVQEGNGGNCRECVPANVEAVVGGDLRGRQMHLDEVGADPEDGCRTRTFECRGQNPQLLWNGGADGTAVPEAPDGAAVRKTLKCNAAGQWILQENNRNTVIDQVHCVAVALEEGGEACRNCDPTAIALNKGAGWEALVVEERVGDGGCATRSFECRGGDGAVRSELVWNMGMVLPSMDDPARVRRDVRCNDAGLWELVDAERAENVVVREVGCRVERGAVPPCRNCGAVNVVGAVDRDEAGVDAADGCATRTFECRGGQNPLRTALVWNGARSSIDTLERVERTLRCNQNAQWILQEDGENIAVREVACDVVLAGCRECVAEGLVTENFQPENLNFELAEGECARMDVICQGQRVRWNNGADGETEAEGEFAFAVLGCSNDRQWLLRRENQAPVVVRQATCIANGP
ncbi:hypothetical protein QR680_017091 [Steinernema hermaphroditum]|uniref:C6 domain-containing protein n=1 Tax=Steinernema hermaphroditum TaxID=289476 RepID=A0AA39LNH9_9BILA|nr:hypothetical protein QR680_017091 [Steinernema hermaphroditum]